LNHAAHLLGEAALGLAGVLAIAGCVLAWRLAQGPIDVTRLVTREHALLDAKGSHVTIGRAALAWEGFNAVGQPLDVVVEDVAATTADGGTQVVLRRARVAVSIPQLLLGRLAVRTVYVDGAELSMDLGAASRKPPAAGPTAAARPATPTGIPVWLRTIERVQLHHAAVTLRGVLPGAELRAPQAELDIARMADGGLAGSAQLALEAGGARSRLDVQAAVRDGGTELVATTTPISPAALAGLSPALVGLRALAAPVAFTLQTRLGPSLEIGDARLLVSGGAGMLRVGQGSVALSSLAAVLTVRPAEARLESFRLALAPLSGPGVSSAPPPVITASATATRQLGRVHATFGVAIDAASMADLPLYWPEGLGGGTRPWLVQNVPAGRAHDAHVSGALDGPADLSDLQLTALSGGLVVDDATVFWLRPIGGLEHVQARVAIEGPDALMVTMDKGGQNNLRLAPGSFIRITGLSKPHQFGDIDAGLSGALPDALGLLNHPRLRLLSRGGMDIEGASGDVSARLKMHIPLEDTVTMDDISIGATANLHGVHLGRIAAGRDLDHGELTLKVTGDGLTAAGTGEVSGITGQLGLDMDFRGGPASQVLQHVTATGTATSAQLMTAGAPVAVSHLLAAGAAGLSLDYTGRRDDTATLQVDADLTGAAVKMPVGWSKPKDAPALAGGRVTLNHGHLTGVENLHAEGPGLAIVSRAQIGPGGETLALDRLDIGGTRARGSVVFPASPRAPLRIVLSGPKLDLSSQFDEDKPDAKQAAAAAKKAPVEEPEEDDKPGQPWVASLKFDQVQLSRGKVLAPLTAEAASDGLHILHAQVRAGTQGELVASITPRAGGRDVSITAADAGTMLRALDVDDNLSGGRLQLEGAYDDARPGSPLSGTAILANDFSIRRALAVGRVLQAMTLYGLTDVARGPGLHFSRLVAPFRWYRRVLTLTGARAFSSSLGITAQGDIDLRRQTANVTGTVVPAYFFNQLLGDLPVVGKIFSPEKGGGLFAARYSVRGPLADPKVGINPLSALTPGFLREGFGLLKPGAAKTPN
jgi:hypothetical protein